MALFVDFQWRIGCVSPPVFEYVKCTPPADMIDLCSTHPAPLYTKTYGIHSMVLRKYYYGWAQGGLHGLTATTRLSQVASVPELCTCTRHENKLDLQDTHCSPSFSLPLSLSLYPLSLGSRSMEVS